VASFAGGANSFGPASGGMSISMPSSIRRASVGRRCVGVVPIAGTTPMLKKNAPLRLNSRAQGTPALSRTMRSLPWSSSLPSRML